MKHALAQDVHPRPGARRRLASAASSVAVVLAVAAAPLHAGRLPRYGGSLRLQLASVPQDLDPLRLGGDDARLVASCLFEGLTSAASGPVTPSLARQWTQDGTASRWLFTLRTDAIFHDGTRCNPQAVLEALQRLADPRQSPHAWLLAELVGWEDFAAGRSRDLEGLYAIAPDQVELQFSVPVPDLPERLALPQAVIAKRRGDTWIGTGAFRVDSLSTQALLLVAHREHHAGRPFLERCEFVARRAGDTVLDTDVVEMLRVQTAEVQPAGTARWESPAWRLGLAVVRPESPVLASTPLRRKLALSFDRDVFVRAVLSGGGRAATGLSPAAPKLVLARTPEPSGDLAMRPQQRARILVPASEPVLRALGERLQVRLFALGLNADLDVLPAEAMASAVAARAYDILVCGWTPPSPPPGRLEASLAARLLLHDVLRPALGDSLPEAWAALGRARDPKDAENALLRGDYVVPLVFFHDAWQASADLMHVQLGSTQPFLGIAGAHLDPTAP